MTYVSTSKEWIRICDALRDLVPFLQFTKREKHPWRNAYCPTRFLIDAKKKTAIFLTVIGIEPLNLTVT